MIRLKNKKADGKIISVYWFVVLVIVAGGIVLMVNLYYNSPYDVREIEADLLSEKVANCIYFSRELNSELISGKGVFKEEFKDHFAEKCSLNLEATGQWEKTQYYIEVKLYDYLNEKDVLFEMSEGNVNVKSDCDLEQKKYDNLVVCAKKDFYEKRKGDSLYLIKTISVVRKTEQNVN